MQDTISVNLQRKEVTIAQVFKELQQQTGFIVFYNNSLLNDQEKLDVNFVHADVRQVMDYVTRNLGLSYVIKDRFILLQKNSAQKSNDSFDSSNYSSRRANEDPVADTLITGTVKSEKGDPLPGVSVGLKGTQIGTITDAQGRYIIASSNMHGFLVFSYVGYGSEDISINGRQNIDVVMKSSVSSLDQLVVVGYGTQKKKDLTGAVSSVDNTRFETLPNTNITQALRGTVPGVGISAGGNAGSGSSVSIRGQNSINGGNSALIVVDGIIYNGQLGDLNPNDIASIDVLRDASSAAIFGSRAANGVVLITTKKGTTTKPTIHFNSYAGVQNMLMTEDLETPKQYVQKKIDYQATLAYRGVAPEPDPSNPVQYLNKAEVENYKSGRIIDPIDVVTRTAVMQSYNLNIGANTGKTNYFIAGNWTDQKGIVIGDRFKRATVRVNLETNVTDWLKFGTKSSFSFVDVSGSPASLGSAFELSPYATWYLDSAKTVLNPIPMTDGLIGNPLMPTLNQITDQRKDLFSILYAEINVPFIKGLTYRLTYSNDLISSIKQTFVPSFNAGGLNRVASSSNITGHSQDMYLESLIKYNHTFAQNHHLDITLLYNYNLATDKSITADANTFPTDVLSYYSLSLGENQIANASYSDYHAIAMMARVNYAYKDRYLLTLTGRRDGASLFSENNKFAFFPSMGVGWVLSEENFLKNSPIIDFLKLRFSWGANGNQAIKRYQSLSRIETGDGFNYLLGGNTAYGIAKASLGNPDLKWEATYATNYGLDFTILKNRISGSLNYYNSNTKNLLMDRTIPVLNGFSNVLSNLGAVNNKGFEIELNTVNIKSNTIEWRTGLNFARNKNKIVHLYGVKGQNGKELDDIANNWFIGKSLGAYYNYVPDGIWQIGDDIPKGFRPGDVRLKDLNHDEIISADSDRAILGYDKPDFTFGFNTTFRYKGFSFYALLTGAVGGVRDNSVILNPANFTYRMHSQYVDWWTPKDPSDIHPSMDYQNAYRINYLQNTTWLRVQDVSLSYDFPKSVINRLKMNQLQVYISSKNTFLFSNWGGWDPETTTGSGRGAYPTMRSFILGINLSL